MAVLAGPFAQDLHRKSLLLEQSQPGRARKQAGQVSLAEALHGAVRYAHEKREVRDRHRVAPIGNVAPI